MRGRLPEVRLASRRVVLHPRLLMPTQTTGAAPAARSPALLAAAFAVVKLGLHLAALRP